MHSVHCSLHIVHFTFVQYAHHGRHFIIDCFKWNFIFMFVDFIAYSDIFCKFEHFPTELAKCQMPKAKCRKRLMTIDGRLHANLLTNSAIRYLNISVLKSSTNGSYRILTLPPTVIQPINHRLNIKQSVTKSKWKYRHCIHLTTCIV